MTYTDDPNANWNFDSRSKRPPRVAPPPPEPPPPPAAEPTKPETKTWQQLVTAILEALLPHPEAYAVVRQLTETVIRQLERPPRVLPRPAS